MSLMRLIALCTAVVWTAVSLTSAATASDWPQWRGPQQNGSTDETDLPVQWSTTDNVAWSADLPGSSASTPIVAGDLMLVEVLQGFRTDSDFATARELLMSLSVVNMLNTSIALRSAANFRTLRKKGITVRKTIDTIIATYCIENNVPLLYSDKDFQPFRQHLNLQSAL